MYINRPSVCTELDIDSRDLTPDGGSAGQRSTALTGHLESASECAAGGKQQPLERGCIG